MMARRRCCAKDRSLTVAARKEAVAGREEVGGRLLMARRRCCAKDRSLTVAGRKETGAGRKWEA